MVSHFGGQEGAGHEPLHTPTPDEAFAEGLTDDSSEESPQRRKSIYRLTSGRN